MPFIRPEDFLGMPIIEEDIKPMRSTTFETARVGDRVWSAQWGFGTIKSLNNPYYRDGDHTIEVSFNDGGFECYDKSGKSRSQQNRELYWDMFVPAGLPLSPIRKIKKTFWIKICLDGSYYPVPSQQFYKTKEEADADVHLCLPCWTSYPVEIEVDET